MDLGKGYYANYSRETDENKGGEVRVGMTHRWSFVRMAAGVPRSHGVHGREDRRQLAVHGRQNGNS